MRRHDDGPVIITCERCGHRATTRARGFPALGANDLVGKVLRCSYCGHRQTLGPPVPVASGNAERRTQGVRHARGRVGMARP
jgi:DNA-directed RNA polymerase subunit RPC12/RpoP